MVKRHAKKLLPLFLPFKKKRISLHTIHPSHTATHLLRAGVDISTITAWLSHISINITNISAKVALEMKARALACCEAALKETVPRHWKNDK